MSQTKTIAYFSMEIGIRPEMPTYSGGLGILAGDTIRSAADMNLPMVAMCLIHRRGCFLQKLDAQGKQTEEPADWPINTYLQEMPARVAVSLDGRIVHLRAWKYEVEGASGGIVPIFFIDSDLIENTPSDRELCHYLYGGDNHYRLCQEWILGVGGVKLLRALGYSHLETFHMNEGHAAFLTLEILNERLNHVGRTTPEEEDIDFVRRHCVFTTHTPVPAGHDRFPIDMVTRALRPERIHQVTKVLECQGELNMTHLALRCSRFVNGVAHKHAEISRKMFNTPDIQAITNGIHHAFWASDSLAKVYDEYLPGWRQDPYLFRKTASIPKDKIWEAHQISKQELIDYANRKTGANLDVDVFTIGFARRAAAYKRADLIFQDTARLLKIVKEVGPIQLIFAGKAHPRDTDGKALIQRIFQNISQLKGKIKIAYLENYDMVLGKMITSGVDLWLNTPQPPLEASGTSGMKAALNGVPSLSSLDGWWLEGFVDGQTGWAIGKDGHDVAEVRDKAQDAEYLYQQLEHNIIPTYYHIREKYIYIMQHCIGINGSYFNTNRMMQDYVTYAYFPGTTKFFRW